MQPSSYRSFATRDALEAWLASNHATERELWIRMFKKGSGVPSVAWEDCVLAALAWGWIDGVRRALDDVSFVQRLTPRRAKSSWSKRNREHAERLIAEGRMQPAGLVHVEAARRDGRWEQAYAGSADMVMPDDFLAALERNRAAKARYEALPRSIRFSIYLRLQTAKRPETRAKRMKDVLAKLAKGESIR